jgi:hypothetical protein
MLSHPDSFRILCNHISPSKQHSFFYLCVTLHAVVRLSNIILTTNAISLFDNNTPWMWNFTILNSHDGFRKSAS